MKLISPFIISARLLPAVKIADCTISMEAIGCKNNRLVYRIFFDFDDGKAYTDDNFASPRDDIQEAFASITCFLGAAAESYRYGMGKGDPWSGENSNLFDRKIVEWAYQNSDEIDMLHFELEEKKDLITEED